MQSNNNIYSFTEEAANKLATKKMIALFPMMVCLVFTAFVIANAVKDNGMTQDKEFIYILGIVGLIIVVAGSFAGKKGAKGLFEATKFALDDTSLEKQIPNAKNVKISFRDIKSYRESKNGFRVRAMKKQIFVPSVVTDYSELVSKIKKNTQSGVINYSTKFKLNEYAEMNLVGLGLMAIAISFFVLDGKIYKLIFGIPLLFGLLYAIYDAYTNKHTQTNEGALGKIMLYTLILIGYLIYILVT
ncbi:hypothetical protein UMM65_11415 [Aureibaculum sp. 2210JD6-5]|uniref:hypothetical protein n=1 Tax=Aureibaculum sp. 2210JD6-5 TaxID=3103957 RepID=UPI002AAEC7BD|nr:hypothetical protein [Aureibaculum sp. 2210JD6-5]MDY7395855.1 hypothetical protein [Aureibaculum sp. 2210JD6-5]